MRGEGEIVAAALGLRAPIGLGRNLDIADRVAFRTHTHAISILVIRIAPAQIIATRPSNCQYPPSPTRLRSHAAPSQTRTSAGVSTRSEEHTSELQSLMRISYAVFCLQKKKKTKQQQ